MENSEPHRVNILLIGGGGREHALAWKLAQSPRAGRIFITHPDNPGLAALGTPIDVPFDVVHPFRLQRFCDKNAIGLVVIGPEEPLAAGAADALAAPGRAVFGPSARAARLEADKAWAKSVMRTAAIPTAEARVFTDPDAALAFVRSRTEPYVVKASGLAKGKGVIVPQTVDEAAAAVERVMVRREFGDAGATAVIEERLTGREVSVLALVDGRTIFLLEPCRDHKRLGDGDTGPNTGGMGVTCPGGELDDDTLGRVQREVLVPIVDTLRRDGIEYRGVLYAGLMLTPAGPKVLEFNVRFGDPECQALMPRLRADLVSLLIATATGRLHECDMSWEPGASCCVVLASGGYPGSPRLGVPIEGIDAAAAVEGVVVFHAGTRRDPTGQIVTAGGRALNVVAVGESLPQARDRAYRAAAAIHFEGKTLRYDIGTPLP